MAERAEIIFTPYNYLIDPNLRHAFGKKFDWKNAILLFDEAHNVEQACASVASFDLPAAHLAQAVREAQEAFELAAKEEEHDLAKNENEQTLRFNARGREKHDGLGVMVASWG
jgi:Rad3-related DNA helicase